MPVVWPRLSCTPRAALAFAITGAMGSLGQEIDANTIGASGAKQEQHRRDLGETNRIRVKRRLTLLRTWTVHKLQLDFFTFCSLFQHVLATASIP
jgi:hypothetical protein